MIKTAKRLIALLSFVILFSFGAGPAHAWYMELTDVVGDIAMGTYYTQTINFHSDTGNDKLNEFFLAVGYDKTKVGLVGIVYQDYLTGTPPFTEVIWDGGLFSHNDESDELAEPDGGIIYNINGSETFGYINEYAPPAGDTLMATIYWDPLVTEDDVTISLWKNHDRIPPGVGADDFVTVDQVQYWDPDDSNPAALEDEWNYNYRDLVVNTHNIAAAPVPIPGAIFLLGPALLGLIGLRRKKA